MLIAAASMILVALVAGVIPARKAARMTALNVWQR
jgi:ABC-type antimicrobial peptide transport system permease subunit